MVTIKVAAAHEVLALFTRALQTSCSAIIPTALTDLSPLLPPTKVKLFTSIFKGPRLGQGHIAGSWKEVPSSRSCGPFFLATLF